MGHILVDVLQGMHVQASRQASASGRSLMSLTLNCYAIKSACSCPFDVMVCTVLGCIVIRQRA
jgi:hypothetical protein